MGGRFRFAAFEPTRQAAIGVCGVEFLGREVLGRRGWVLPGALRHERNRQARLGWESTGERRTVRQVGDRHGWESTGEAGKNLIGWALNGWELRGAEMKARKPKVKRVRSRIVQFSGGP